MSSRDNYIEVSHEFIDRDGDRIANVRWAVRPNSGRLFCDSEGREATYLLETRSWRIEPGEPIHIYTQSDIDGLRKLLDAIEEQITTEKENQ